MSMKRMAYALTDGVKYHGMGFPDALFSSVHLAERVRAIRKDNARLVPLCSATVADVMHAALTQISKTSTDANARADAVAALSHPWIAQDWQTEPQEATPPYSIPEQQEMRYGEYLRARVVHDTAKAT
jgi:hypothetical protein